MSQYMSIGKVAKLKNVSIKYNIKVTNPNNVEKGIQSITMDGVSVEGCVIPYVAGKEKYDVLVTMG